MEKKQTAVEWLYEVFYGTETFDQEAVLKIAKEMEKEQLGNAFLAGGKSRNNLFKGLEFQTIEEYIEETFESE